MSIFQLADIGNVDEFAYGSAVNTFLKFELEKTNLPHLSNVDEQLFDSIQKVIKTNDINLKVQNLREIHLRAKIQSIFFTVFMYLHTAENMITMDGVQEPIKVANCSDDQIRDVANALGCFSFVPRAIHSDGGFDFHTTFGFDSYNHPGIWLVGMIIRGAVVTDLRCIFERIQCFREWVVMEVEIFEKHWSLGRQLVKTVRAGFDFAISDGLPVLCFWLPYSFGPVQDCYELYKVFDSDNFIRIDELFNRYFEIVCQPGNVYELLPWAILST